MPRIAYRQQLDHDFRLVASVQEVVDGRQEGIDANVTTLPRTDTSTP